MSQNQEIIEAKLCAYIDGELDSEGIAEIEKHLEANPQHRRLLESLKATRDLIRWLPRENAPTELAETLNGQLERSVLLDDDNDRSMRISPWPRILAAAAIVLLTAGLGAAVYFALPKHKAPVPYARADESKSRESHPPLVSTTEPEERGEAGERPSDRGSESELMRKSGSVAKGGGEETSDDDLNRLLKEVKENPDRVFASAAGGLAQRTVIPDSATTQPAVPEALVMLVASADAGSTQNQLAEYFESNRIEWKAVPEPMPTARDNGPSQQMDARPVQQNLAQLRRADAQEGPQQNAANDRHLMSKAAAPEESQATTRSLSVIPRQVASTQQSDHLGADKAETQSLKRDFAYNFPSNNARIDGMYVARMSRRQAETLRVSQQAQVLNDAEDHQQVLEQKPSAYERFARQGRADMRLQSAYSVPGAAATAPSTGIAAAINAAPRREAARFRENFNNANGSATTQSAAAGRGRDGVEARGIHQQSEDLAAPGQPTTRPASEPSITELSTTSAPAVQQPQTQPAEDEPVNVVIVVQQTEPSTQPTTAPAATQP